MTEMVNGEGQTFQSSTPEVPVQTSSTPSQAPADERTFKQHEVNDIVGRARHEAIERYKRDSSIQSHSQQSNQQQQQAYYSPSQQTQSKSMSEDDFRRLAAEETQRLRNEWIQQSQQDAQEQDAQRIASEFFNKIDVGKKGIENFDEVMSTVDLRAIPYHVQLANMVDNTAQVMYELANDPTKIGMIQNLIDIDLKAGNQPKLALNAMKRISDQIKSNEKAQNFKSPNSPLSQMRPANAGTDTNGALTVADYKRKYIV